MTETRVVWDTALAASQQRQRSQGDDSGDMAETDARRIGAALLGGTSPERGIMVTGSASPGYDSNPDGTINLRRKPRLDGLPEHMVYADTGCSISPTCLHCPLKRCRYEEPVEHSGEGKGGRPVLAGRDAAIWARYREMETTIQGFREAVVPVIANEFGVTPRTVFRVVAKARKALEQGITQW